MKKKITFMLMAVLFSIGTIMASDFTVLTTPREVFEKSVELENGARAAFEAVLNNEAATEAEITTAMQTYMQKATPRVGYAFDMNFLLRYTHVTEENKLQYTKTKLAEAWSCDVKGIVFDAETNSLQVNSTEKAGLFMRVDDKANLVTPYGQFIIYQTVELGKGCYHLQSGSFVAGFAKGATLSAGDLADSELILGGGVLQDYQVDFKMDATESIKLGFKRSDVEGKLTQVAFNNMKLYKTSSLIEITDDATEGLSAAENVDVMLCREFKAGQYYNICLPFVIEDWSKVFEEVRAWNNYVDGELGFASASKRTMARKPYLVKVKEDIDENNYIVFRGVKVESGGAGAWTRKKENETDPDFPVKYQGNWAAGTVPANCYYLDGNDWKLSDGTVPQTAFSAYIEATGLGDCPETMTMNVPLTHIRNVAPGGWGTICLPKAVAEGAFSGADFYSIAGKVMKNGVAQYIKLEQVTRLEAGMPYMFCATADKLEATYAGTLATEPGSANGLVGSFTRVAVEEGMYMINDENKIKRCGKDCFINANRAYINLDDVPEVGGEVLSNQRLIMFDGATGVASTLADANELVDVYTMSGIEMRHQVRASEAVKGLPRGMYIVNGRKLIVK